MSVFVSRMFVVSKSDTSTDPTPEPSYADVKVGDSVFLLINGVATEFLVVHKGIPDSELYDSSCDGLWLLAKDIYTIREWTSTSVDTEDATNYAKSTIHTWLNNDFFSLFDTNTQNSIKQVLIPYGVGGGSKTVNSGADGLSCKVFLLSGRELDWNSQNGGFDTKLVLDGDTLAYFDGADNDDYIAYHNGTASVWLTRTPFGGEDGTVWMVSTGGGANSNHSTYDDYGVRPALVLPHNALFDKKTLLFKGVK